MAYGHAERVLDAIRLLEAETRELLSRLPELDAEQSQWLQETTPVMTRPAGRHTAVRADHRSPATGLPSRSRTVAPARLSVCRDTR
jgi:hypothetical protein